MQEVACRAPASVAGSVAVQVTHDGSTYATGELAQFVYSSPLQVEYLSPANGPRRGGTSIAIRGEGYGLTREMRCRFGEIEVTAYRMSEHHINCTSPAHASGERPPDANPRLQAHRFSLPWLAASTPAAILLAVLLLHRA